MYGVFEKTGFRLLYRWLWSLWHFPISSVLYRYMRDNHLQLLDVIIQKLAICKKWGNFSNKKIKKIIQKNIYNSKVTVIIFTFIYDHLIYRWSIIPLISPLMSKKRCLVSFHINLGKVWFRNIKRKQLTEFYSKLPRFENHLLLGKNTEIAIFNLMTDTKKVQIVRLLTFFSPKIIN